MQSYNNKKKVLVFLNDPGSSNYIMSIILSEKFIFNWIVYTLDNSANLKHLKNNKIKYSKFFSLEEINHIIKKCNPDIILYGTGLLNYSEIIKKSAKKYDIKLIALFDHWTGYEKRITVKYCPDVILVLDDIAYKKCKTLINSSCYIFKINNYYLEGIRAKYNSTRKKETDFVVFISEPNIFYFKQEEPDLKYINLYEYDLLEEILYFFDNIIVRLHPKESNLKYFGFFSKFPKKNIKIINSYDEDLAITLSKSKLTIGVQSTALYISYLLGINTISIFPKRLKSAKVIDSHLTNIPIPKKYILDNLKDIDSVKFTKINSKNSHIKTHTLNEIVNFLLMERN